MSDWGFELNWRRMSPGRKALVRRFAGHGKPTAEDAATVSRVLRALAETVSSRDRTELRGFGVFTWRPFRTHLPGGKAVKTVRLWFRSSCMKRRKR